MRKLTTICLTLAVIMKYWESLCGNWKTEVTIGSGRKGVSQAKFNDASSNFAFAAIGMLSGIYVNRGFVWKEA